jgi:hypothetical protein
MNNVDFGIFFFNSEDSEISGNYALHAKLALRTRVAERFPRVLDDGWHVLSGDLFGPRNIHMIITSAVGSPDASLVDLELTDAFAEGRMPGFVPYVIGMFMCPAEAMRFADGRLKKDKVAGYLGLATLVLPNEQALLEVANGLMLPMTKLNSIS